MSDETNNGRCEKTGRFKKGFSGNKAGRRDKNHEPLLPHELATIILDAAATPVDIKDRDGVSRRLPAYEVVLRQLAASAAKGDKTSIRQFTNIMSEATKTMQAHDERQFARLGDYQKARDEGRAWPLDAAEAAFYQDLADKAGFPDIIKAHDPDAHPASVTDEEISAVLSHPSVARYLEEAAHGGLFPDTRRTIVRRVLRAFQELQHGSQAR